MRNWRMWLIQKLLGKTVVLRIWIPDSDEWLEAPLREQDFKSCPIYGGSIRIGNQIYWATIN